MVSSNDMIFKVGPYNRFLNRGSIKKIPVVKSASMMREFCCGGRSKNKTDSRILPIVTERTRMENESRSETETWSRCLIWNQNLPARCRLSTRPSAVRNARVVCFARALTLRFFFILRIIPARTKFLEYSRKQKSFHYKS